MLYAVNVCCDYVEYFDSFGAAVGDALDTLRTLADDARDGLCGEYTADTLRTLDACERRATPQIVIYADDGEIVRPVATFDASMRGLLGDRAVQDALAPK